MLTTQKGFVSIIFIFGLIVGCILVLGGCFFLKNSYLKWENNNSKLSDISNGVEKNDDHSNKDWYIIRINNYHQFKIPNNFQPYSGPGNNGSFPFQGNGYNDPIKMELYDHRTLEIELRKKDKKQTLLEYLTQGMGIKTIESNSIQESTYGGKPGLKYTHITSNPIYLIEPSAEEVIIMTCYPNCYDKETLANYFDPIAMSYKYLYVKPSNTENITYIDPLERYTIEVPMSWDISPLGSESNASGPAQFYKKEEFKIEIYNINIGNKIPKEYFLDNYSNQITTELKNIETEFRVIKPLLGDARMGENAISSIVKGQKTDYSVILYTYKVGQASKYISTFDKFLSTLKSF